MHDHNGRGAWPAVEWSAPRFGLLGVEVKAWRNDGKKILVCAQRGIGSIGRASPAGWEHKVAADLRGQLGVQVVVRPHPGDNDPTIPLERDLDGARACVIWASGAGVKALVEGIPVFYGCPWWICSYGARRYQGAGSLVAPIENDSQRAVALERMAWAQWTVGEIESGEPFRRLVEMPYPKTEAVA